ncbi:hypothetical protein ACPV5G_18515 [Photobacterium damselae]|uniref:hypothetical protein n=1 Tax=Photobacterium damselae TaxID=38293 RepID=UPI004067CEAE
MLWDNQNNLNQITKYNKEDIKPRYLVLKYDNSKDRTGVQSDVLHSVAYYAEAIELFSAHVIRQIDPDAFYELDFVKVSEGSIKDHLLEKLKSAFISSFNGESFVAKLTDSGVTENPESFKKTKKMLEQELSTFFDNKNIKLDSYTLARVMELLSKAGEKTRKDEHIHLYEYKSLENEEKHHYCNAYAFNTSYRSYVKPSDVETPTIGEHNGTDYLQVLVIKNFGNGKWKFKSKKTNDIFEAKITDKIWLHDYQIGNISTITARHTIVVQSRYKKYIYTNKTVIKDAYIDYIDPTYQDDTQGFHNYEIDGDDNS